MGIRTRPRLVSSSSPYEVELLPLETPLETPQTPLVAYPSSALTEAKRSLDRQRPTESSIDRVALRSVKRRAVSAAELEARRLRSLQELATKRETPDGRPLPRSAVNARRKREELVGRTVELSPAWRDPDNPENPFALDATFGFQRITLRAHAEQLEWSHAQWHPSGTLLKARSAEAIERMACALDLIAPLLHELELDLSCVYDHGGRRRGYPFASPLLRPSGAQRRILSVASLDSNQTPERMVEVLLRQLVKQQHPSSDDATYALAYETLMKHYCEHYAEENEAQRLQDSWRSSYWNPSRVVAPQEAPRECVLPDATLDDELEAMLAELDREGGVR